MKEQSTGSAIYLLDALIQISQIPSDQYRYSWVLDIIILVNGEVYLCITGSGEALTIYVKKLSLLVLAKCQEPPLIHQDSSGRIT